ncbi:NmrA family NAD(P)-binding protein [Mucilaginibacter sp. UR6-11]|uniref:NmrA family NAD(P)-binding protein n=1 Tax=Mucilaginibacter sp. UR6-11 TaxID=1435644 RepID=UPI001E2F36B5|nr:NmrA family NAD(P)-binding protein [Mucilaginibacter sp. UR6-11]MCC8426783.1 NmrA family NAD(P)-binding protein [Mucilaginibacter sp. UR6-11]
MNITITGSLGHISKPLTEILVKAGHQVTVISSNADRAQEIKALGAIPAIGEITDVSFLTSAFKGADAVYTMVPPNFGAAEWKNWIAGIGQNYADAITAAGVTKVVNLSSIGAHLEDGTGPITGSHRVENILNALDGVAVKHLRAAFFYINFYANVDMIKHAGIIGSNFGADTNMVLVHPNDIAQAVAEELQSNFTGKSVRYVASDEKTAGEVARALGAAIGKPELPWVEFNDADNTAGAIGAGLPEEIATNYTEMGAAARTGILWEDYLVHKPVLGKIKLEDFAKEFAANF